MFTCDTHCDLVLFMPDLSRRTCVLDGMQVYDDPEGWSPYWCELPICRKAPDLIKVGFSYETDFSDLVTVKEAKPKWYGQQLCWHWLVVDHECGDSEEHILTHEFLRIAF